MLPEHSLMLPEHSIGWFLDRDTIYGRLTCTAPPMAPCHQVCEQGCEVAPCHIEGHEVIDGSCNAVEWIESCGAIEEFYGGDDERPLRDGPVMVTWTGDDWRWTYAQ